MLSVIIWMIQIKSRKGRSRPKRSAAGDQAYMGHNTSTAALAKNPSFSATRDSVFTSGSDGPLRERGKGSWKRSPMPMSKASIMERWEGCILREKKKKK